MNPSASFLIRWILKSVSQIAHADKIMQDKTKIQNTRYDHKAQDARWIRVALQLQKSEQNNKTLRKKQRNRSAPRLYYKGRKNPEYIHDRTYWIPMHYLKWKQRILKRPEISWDVTKCLKIGRFLLSNSHEWEFRCKTCVTRTNVINM